MSNTPEPVTRGSAEAKVWAVEQSCRIGAAVQAYRKNLGLTMLELADRTSELGYPITRGTIAKIEGNHRVGKFDLAELVVLAAALDIPPVLLLYPEQADGHVEILPGIELPSIEATQWFSGESAQYVDDSNQRERRRYFVDALTRARALDDLRGRLARAERVNWYLRFPGDATDDDRARSREHLEQLREDVRRAETEQWPAGWKVEVTEHTDLPPGFEPLPSSVDDA